MFISQVQFDANDEFFLSSSLEIHELGDDFVAAGSAGTARTKKKKITAKTGKPGKLVDVNLLRVQFSGKLQSNYKFCNEALKQALLQATQFRMSTSFGCSSSMMHR